MRLLTSAPLAGSIRNLQRANEPSISKVMYASNSAVAPSSRSMTTRW